MAKSLRGGLLIKVKICGTTNVFDARKTAKFSIDYLGVVVNVPFSERSVSVSRAKEIAEAVNSPINVVVLFFNQPASSIKDAVTEIKPFAVQLLGNESASFVRELKDSIPCQIWKSVFLPSKDQVLSNHKTRPNCCRGNCLPQDASGLSASGAQACDQPTGLTRGSLQLKALIESYIDADVDAILLDTADLVEGRFGGTGKISDLNIAREIVKTYEIPIFLAGGINPKNVTEAINSVNPHGIDLCSGVEKYKGKRDFCKLKQLMDALETLK